ELGRGDAAADAVLRFLTSTVGKADDRERRLAQLDVRLDFDAPRVEPDERVGEHAGEHMPIEPAETSHVCAGTVTVQARATRTSSKYSPARRPVRLLTWRRRRCSRTRAAQSRISG